MNLGADYIAPVYDCLLLSLCLKMAARSEVEQIANDTLFKLNFKITLKKEQLDCLFELVNEKNYGNLTLFTSQT